MLINTLSPISIVVMSILSCPEIRVLPSGSVQVMLGGLGIPEAVQVNIAVLGEVTTCDEGYSVMLAATMTKCEVKIKLALLNYSITPPIIYLSRPYVGMKMN